MVTSNKRKPMKRNTNTLEKSAREMGRPVITSLNRPAIHTFTRDWIIGNANASAAGDAVGAYAFNLSSLPSYTEFTALFDQYRFKRVDISFWPLQSVATSTANAIPTIATVIDYDDNALLANLPNAMQYSNCVLHNPYKPFTVSFRPHLPIAAFDGTFNAFANTQDQWIDSGSPNALHYGLKWATPQANGLPQVWFVTGRALIECKNTR
jgi:hypothetical protein